MRNTTTKLVMTALIATSLCSPLAMAANNAQQFNHHKGFYIGGGAGGIVSTDYFRTSYICKQGGSCVNINGNNKYQRTFTIDADAGYDFNAYLGAEIGYIYVGQMNATDNSGLVSPAFHTGYAAGKLTLPLGNKVALFGKLGVARSFWQDSQGHTANEGAIYAAAGASYNFSKKISANVQCQGVAFLFSTYNVLSAGITYHF